MQEGKHLEYAKAVRVDSCVWLVADNSFDSEPRRNSRPLRDRDSRTPFHIEHFLPPASALAYFSLATMICHWFCSDGTAARMCQTTLATFLRLVATEQLVSPFERRGDTCKCTVLLSRPLLYDCRCSLQHYTLANLKYFVAARSPGGTHGAEAGAGSIRTYKLSHRRII